MMEPQTVPTRDQLAVVAAEPRTRLAFESLFKFANSDLPEAINHAQETADEAKSEAEALKSPQYIVTALNAAIPNARRLTGDTGVTVDISVEAVAKIVVDVLQILGYTPVDPGEPVILTETLEVDGATTAHAGLKVTGQTETDTLRINQTPTASTATVNFTVPVVLDGTTYYLGLSDVP